MKTASKDATFIITLEIDDDMIDWRIFASDGERSLIDTGRAAVISDAMFDAGIALRDFIPEWLR